MGRIPEGSECSAGTRNEEEAAAAEWQVIKAFSTVGYLPGPCPALVYRLATETPGGGGPRRCWRPASLELDLPLGHPHQSQGLSQAEAGKDYGQREGHMQRPVLALSSVTESSQRSLREASLPPFYR